jgi:uncharacterized damage-inducible protein DinB
MSPSAPSNPDRATILDALHESYGGPAWHGPSVTEALAGVDASTASHKPSADRNSIHELVLHLAHGRHLLIERLTGAPLADFPRSLREPWWPVPSEEQTEARWRSDLALLDDYHSRLIAAIGSASGAQLQHVPGEGGGYSVARQLLGMALHDTYHAGQIRLLALLQRPS